MSTEIIALDESKGFTDGEIKAIEKQYLTVMKNLSEVVKQKKKLEDDEKKVKKQLEQVMDEYGIKSIDNQYLKIIRVAGSEGKTTIDLDAMEKKEPDLFKELLADYPKTTGAKKASIRFDVK